LKEKVAALTRPFRILFGPIDEQVDETEIDQTLNSTADNVEVILAEAPARFDVTFSGDRLGFDLGESPEVGGLPIVSSVDVVLAARSASSTTDDADAGAADVASCALQLPEVGDSVLAVNGEALDYSAHVDLFDAALDLIAAAGRPLLLTFVRGFSTTNEAISASAANNVESVGSTKALPVEASLDQDKNAESKSGAVFNPEGGDELRGLQPLVEEDEASTATWMSAGDGSIVASGELMESSQTDLVEISDSRVSYGNAGLDSASFGGSLTVGGSMTLGGADPSLSVVHAGDEPASICDNFDSDHGNAIGSPVGENASALVLPESNEASSGTGSLEKVEGIRNTPSAANSSVELTVTEAAQSLGEPTASEVVSNSVARNTEERADHIFFESVDAGTEEATGEESVNSSDQQQQQRVQPEKDIEQEPKRETLFGGTSEVLRLAKEKAAARLERRGLDLAALDLSTLEAMLDDLKAGWGARFAPAFAAVGLEDVDDLADMTPDEMVKNSCLTSLSSLLHIESNCVIDRCLKCQRVGFLMSFKLKGRYS